MFFIKKLIEFSILPPGVIILALLLLVFLGKKIRSVLIISFLSAFILYLSSIKPVSNMLLRPLETTYPVPSAKIIGEPSAIIVLSSGAYNKKTIDGDSFNRLFEGFKLYKKYHIPVILSGGYAISTFSVAKIMRNILLEMGVKKSYIITEDKSNDTYQNALYVLKICKRRNFRRVIIVTSAYHMSRAMFLFNKFKGGIKVIPYPTDFKTDKHYNIYGYIPQLGNLIISEEAMHEYIGYFYYYIKERI